MRKAIWPALALVLAAAGTVQADWLKDFYGECKRDFHRNNAWPEPFNYPDRDAIYAPFAVMVHNGWRMQNTLGKHHFRPGGMELTEAGQLRVMWILTEAPPPYRTIFVERGETAAATAARVRSVQLTGQKLSVDGAMPIVMEAAVPARGWPADQIDATTRQWLNSVPAPRLPTGGGGGASGGASGN